MDLVNELNILEKYVRENYDMNNPLIVTKYVHTLMVVRVMCKICEKMELNEHDTKLATYIALFHDLGRFKEVVRQQGFNNLKFDHGCYSNKILFNDGFIKEFDVDEKDHLLIRKALYYHNKKDLGNDLTEREEFFCRLIRDADRIDIFRVLSFNKNIFEGISSVELLNAFYNNESIDIKDLKTRGDRVLLRFGFIKVFSFPESFEVLKLTGNFDKYVKSIKVSEDAKELFLELVKEIEGMLRGEKNYVREKIQPFNG